MGLSLAGSIVKRAVRRKNEKISDLELGICNEARIPYREACWISVPFVVWLGRITKIVEFLCRVILMNILSLAVDRTFEIVTTILDTPETYDMVSISSKQYKTRGLTDYYHQMSCLQSSVDRSP